MNVWRRVWAGALALTLGCLGCSSGERLHPVSGKVLYKGQPLAGALVTLHPQGSNDPRVERPNGFTQEDGTFTVTTGQKPGAPAGQYLVTVICSRTVQPEGKGKIINTGGEDSVDILGGAYANPNTSKITVQVQPGNNTLPPIELH
jgi:hypothetical protein